jgi:hypothetical protein
LELIVVRKVVYELPGKRLKITKAAIYDDATLPFKG